MPAARGVSRPGLRDPSPLIIQSFRQQPAAVEDRAVPAIGKAKSCPGSKNSYIATLVERHKRYVILMKIANKIERVFADGGYAGEPRYATATRIIVEIVAKSPDQIGFAVLPRRWVVERFFAWIGRNRRACKRFRGQRRLRPGLPLRRFRHAALTPHRKARMSFGDELLGSKPLLLAS